MQLSTRLAARACHLVPPLSLLNDFGVGAESSGSLKTRLVQMQAECPWVVVANSKDMAVHAALLPFSSPKKNNSPKGVPGIAARSISSSTSLRA